MLTCSPRPGNKGLEASLTLELLDGMESVGDRLWRMERRLTTPPVDQAGARKRAAKKRRPAHKQSAARTRSDK